MITNKLLQKGRDLLEAGCLVAAEEKFRDVLRLEKNNVDAWNLLGVVHLSNGKFEDSINDFSQALKIQPSFSDAHFNLGLARLETADRLGAIDSFQEAFDIHPNKTNALIQLSSLLMEIGENYRAHSALKKGIKLNLHNAELWINLCGVSQNLGYFEDSRDAGERSIQLAPDSHLAHYNLARAYGKLSEWEKAHYHYDKCLLIVPSYVNAYCNKAKIYIKQTFFCEAEKQSLIALSYVSDYPEALSTLALSLASQGRFWDAIPIYRKSLSFFPEDATTRFNLAMALLVTQQFTDGWNEYESGILTGKRDVTYYPDVSVWDGEPLNGKHIHIIGEQGIGEEIMFSTMLADMVETGASVSFEVNHRLVPIFSRSFDHVCVVERGRGNDILRTTPKPKYQISAGEMAKYFRGSIENFHPKSGFLKPDPERVALIKSRYDDLGTGLKVGLSWKTSSPVRTELRNIPLTEWSPILELDGCHFISLQYGDNGDECKGLNDSKGLLVHVDSLVCPIDSIEDSIAQVAAMDLVISISNSTVHLAAAAGIETWVILEKAPHWHWFLDSDTCQWYKCVEFFRQQNQGQWEGVISQISKRVVEKFNLKTKI